MPRQRRQPAHPVQHRHARCPTASDSARCPSGRARSAPSTHRMSSATRAAQRPRASSSRTSAPGLDRQRRMPQHPDARHPPAGRTRWGLRRRAATWCSRRSPRPAARAAFMPRPPPAADRAGNRRPPVRPIAQAQPPAMFLGDLVADRQAKTGAAPHRLGGEERIEDRRRVDFRHAGPVVGAPPAPRARPRSQAAAGSCAALAAPPAHRPRSAPGSSPPAAYGPGRPSTIRPRQPAKSPASPAACMPRITQFAATRAVSARSNTTISPEPSDDSRRRSSTMSRTRSAPSRAPSTASRRFVTSRSSRRSSRSATSSSRLAPACTRSK